MEENEKLTIELRYQSSKIVKLIEERDALEQERKDQRHNAEVRWIGCTWIDGCNIRKSEIRVIGSMSSTAIALYIYIYIEVCVSECALPEYYESSTFRFLHVRMMMMMTMIKRIMM